MVRFVDRLAYTCAVGFGSGLMKPAPGTWGSLLGALLFWGLLSYSFMLCAMLLLAGTLLGGYICHIGGLRLGEVDHGSIVWDEIIAVGWALWLVVAVGVSLDAWRVLLIFVLFRVFDIVKPWPIYFVDAWHTSWGVMWDDLLAAAYTVIGFFILMPLWI
jgi:phosphatidylglycerophosphatase A